MDHAQNRDCPACIGKTKKEMKNLQNLPVRIWVIKILPLIQEVVKLQGWVKPP